VGLLVIIVWIWGSATLALSESLKCKSETKLVVRANEYAAISYYIGVNSKEGSATCENGETATVKSYALWESNTKEVFAKEYELRGSVYAAELRFTPECKENRPAPKAFSNFQNSFYSLNVVAHGIRMLEPVVLRASRSRCASAAFLSG
jgi:hypothetical protein